MRTARAMIIDEDHEEAIALMSALARLGIGAIYVQGDDENALPTEPCHGIRVVFLDLQMVPNPEPRNFIPHSVGVLSRCVDFSTGRTGIICWTKHEEDIPELQEELDRLGISPAFVQILRNKRTLAIPSQRDALQRSLDAVLYDDPAQCLMNSWEQVAHAAASLTTEKLVAGASEAQHQLSRLGALSIAVGGSNQKNYLDRKRCVRDGLAALHADSVRHSVQGCWDSTHVNCAAKKLHDETRRAPGIHLTSKAAMNSTLLLAPSSDQIRPGNVYRLSSVRRSFIASQHVPKEQRAARLRTGRGTSSSRRTQTRVEDLAPTALFRSEQDGVKLFEELYGERTAKHKSTAKYSVKWGAIEVTPPCDAAQHNATTVRLLRCLLLSLEPMTDDFRENKWRLAPQNTTYAKETEWFLLDGRLTRLIAVARDMIAIDKSQLEPCRAVFRLQESVLTDFQAWFSSHASRPGYVGVR